MPKTISLDYFWLGVFNMFACMQLRLFPFLVRTEGRLTLISSLLKGPEKRQRVVRSVARTGKGRVIGGRHSWGSDLIGPTASCSFEVSVHVGRRISPRLNLFPFVLHLF